MQLAQQTTVIDCHIANLKKLGYRSLEHWLSSDPTKHVYIGRKTYVAGSFDSKWRNPFKVDKTKGKDDIKRVLREYLIYLKRNPELLNNIRTELCGKEQGCWCTPNPCHGDVQAAIANSDKPPLEVLAMIAATYGITWEEKVEPTLPVNC